MNEYYCAFEVKTPVEVTYQDGEILRNRLRKLTVTSEAIGYGDWKVFKVDQLWKIIERNKMYDLMKEKAFRLTTEEFKKWWLSEYTQKEVKKFLGKNKKRRRKLKILILEGLHTKEKKQWRLKRTNLKVGDRVVLDCHDYKIIKVVEEKKPVTLILKDEEAGRVFYKRVKHTSMIVGMTYLVKGRWVKVLKIINRSKKKPKGGLRGLNPKGAIFSEYDIGHEIPDYMKKVLKVLKNPNIIISSPRRHPSIWDCVFLEGQRQKEKKALSKFHKRPYFKVVAEEVKGKPSKGENLAKIKFPCWCEYTHAGTKELGEINKYRVNPLEGNRYSLSNIEKQRGQGQGNVITTSYSLVELMREWRIEILKGELHLWKEVGEYTKRKE